MDGDERKWADEAITLCKTAFEKGISVMLIRRQDRENLADMIVTNVTNGETIKALGEILNSPDEEEN